MPFETCHHIKVDGVYCASPAVRGRKYCYTHLMHRGRRLRRALAQSRSEASPLILPPLENLGAMRVALSEIVQALAAGQLDHRSAGLMLYAIQQATTVSLRMAQIEQQEAAQLEVASDDSTHVQEYPDFERNLGLPIGIDLDAETDRAMRRAEEQAAVLSIAPTYQPGTNCPVSPKLHYTREEAYQLMQWQIHRLQQQIRSYEEVKKLELSKKPAASATLAPDPVSNTA